MVAHDKWVVFMSVHPPHNYKVGCRFVCSTVKGIVIVVVARQTNTTCREKFSGAIDHHVTTLP